MSCFKGLTQGFLSVFKKMSGYDLKSDLQRSGVGLGDRGSIPSKGKILLFSTAIRPARPHPVS
jgi:hypothetical protein